MRKPGEQEANANLSTILEAIPHRYPFLLIDRITEYVAYEHAVMLKNVTINEGFFQGHFPEHPVMPGVLVVEAMAQAAGVFAVRSIGKEGPDHIVYLMGLDNVRFRRPVVPGDQLWIRVEKQRIRENVWRVGATAEVDGERAAEAVLTAMIRHRDQWTEDG